MARPFVRLSNEGCFSGMPSRSSRTEDEPWESIAKHFVAFDVAKKKHVVAIAEGGRTREVRFVGEVENGHATIERMIKKWEKSIIDCTSASGPGRRVTGCAGRQVRDLGPDCMVVAPALIPKRWGE